MQFKLFQRYELANIPMRYQRFNFERDFINQQNALEFVQEYTANVDNAIRHGLGMYVYSAGLGTGKTAIATYVLKQAVLREMDRVKHTCWFDSFFNMLDTPKLNQADRDFREGKYLHSDILVIDDVIPAKISEKQEAYYSDILERTVRHRAHNSLSTIVTTNMVPEDLSGAFGRVFSLLSDSCEPVQLSSDIDSRIERGVGLLLRQSLRGEVSPII
jgi:DNA replication protein DnaC